MSIRLGLLTVLGICAGAYAAFVIEASCAARTVLPHFPATMLVFCIWTLPAAPGVIAASFFGLGCDLIGDGTIGPGMIAAALVAFFGGGLRRRAAFASDPALMMFLAATVAVFLVAREWGLAALDGRALDRSQTLWIAAARGISSAAALAIPLASVRLLMRARRVFAAL